MGCFNKLFSILTCGLGPYIWIRIKNKIKFHQWHLRSQILFGVFLAFSFIQVAFLWDIYEMMHWLFNKTDNTLIMKINH